MKFAQSILNTLSTRKSSPSVTNPQVDTFLAACRNLKVLVIGDLMIDQYLWGRIERISPEAPVPVVDVETRERRLGGAANAALNLRAMGATPYLCGVAGVDRSGSDLMELVEEMGFDNRAEVAYS